MSQPISACSVYKAARGDEEAFKWLVQAMDYNMKCGHWSENPCRCNPPCEKPTVQQLEDCKERLKAELEKLSAVVVAKCLV